MFTNKINRQKNEYTCDIYAYTYRAKQTANSTKTPIFIKPLNIYFVNTFPPFPITLCLSRGNQR